MMMVEGPDTRETAMGFNGKSMDQTYGDGKHL